MLPSCILTSSIIVIKSTDFQVNESRRVELALGNEWMSKSGPKVPLVPSLISRRTNCFPYRFFFASVGGFRYCCTNCTTKIRIITTVTISAESPLSFGIDRNTMREIHCKIHCISFSIVCNLYTAEYFTHLQYYSSIVTSMSSHCSASMSEVLLSTLQDI